jgi:hypothetical protein
MAPDESFIASSSNDGRIVLSVYLRMTAEHRYLYPLLPGKIWLS